MSENINNQFVPYLILEKYLKKKYLPGIKVINGFINYIASYFDVEKSKIWFRDSREWISNHRENCIAIRIDLKNGNHYDINFFEDGNTNGNLFVKETSSSWRGTGLDFKSSMFIKSLNIKYY